MKRKFHHPEAPTTGRQYWRSLGELEDTPEFTEWLQREFPQGAAELSNPDPDAADGGVSRRNFVKLMGAATALAGFGMSGCRRPERFLVPFKEHVEWIVPGKPLLFASAKPRVGGRGCDPLVVTTYEGRPVKVDGNRMHPMVSGGSDAFTQASVLDMYDPDRSRSFLQSGEEVSAEDFEEGFLKGFRAGKGQKAALVIGEGMSPTRSRLIADLQKKLPGLKVFRYEALAADGLRAAEKVLYGEGVIQVPKLDRAEKILSLDCDFLGQDSVGEDSTIEFTRGRRVDGTGSGKDGGMNRLYAVESAFTLTGGMADHRLRLATSQIPAVAILLAEEIAKAAGDAGLEASLKPLVAKVKNAVTFNLEWIAEAAKDLAASKGKSVVLAGSRHSKEVHLLAAAMNAALGASGDGAVVAPAYQTGEKEAPGIAELAAAVDSGEVTTVIFSGDSDPYFDAPADLDLAAKLAADGVTVVHHGVRKNLTAQSADWHVPGAHYLESWGDLYSATGVYSAMQPMILPLFDGLSDLDLLLALGDAPAAATEGDAAIPAEDVASPSMLAVRETFAQVAAKSGAEADKAWNATLRDGYLTGSKFKRAGAPAAVATVDLARIELADLPYPEAVEVVLATSASMFDGRFANNGWMQEAPNPITKLTWDNAALMNVRTAEALDLEDEDLITLTVGDRKVTAPVLCSPGMADFCISLDLGYYGSDGDVDLGKVGSGVGHNAYPLKTTATPYVVGGVKVAKAEGSYALALTAEHYSMEGRAIAREGTVEMLKEDPKFAELQGMDAHIPPDDTLYEGPNYLNPTEKDINPDPANPFHNPFRVDPHHQWAMTIDLHSCIGCNACTIACQAENNIPIVGKEEVIRGREMHWIRMDRYFSTPGPGNAETVSDLGSALDYLTGKESTKETPGRRTVDDDAVEMITQPVACQQCEAAPCETVCPVNATVHTGDGLNAMTYNRCIGTRYCANNCPYKARRFNYFDYNKRPIGYGNLRWGPLQEPTGSATTTKQLQHNPNVSVRMRGVIEKCTYCVQRINSAKIAAKVKARDSDDIQVGTDAIKVACQQACPTDAVVFGNIKREDDAVNVTRNDGRNYDLLRYLGVRPRTTYLARIKNPNPAMPGADKVGHTTSEMH